MAVRRDLEILVIDDEAVPRQSWFKSNLEMRFGWSVAAAHTSSEALEQLQERKFDLAFFDHDLGERDTGSTVATRVLMDPETYHCPVAIWIHSANPVGAENIASKFRSMSVPTRVTDFGVLITMPLDLLWIQINDLVTQGEPR